MSKEKQKRKINKKDYLRALLTDTLPQDIPIIFSNDGFYLNSVKYIYKQSSDYKFIIKELYEKYFNNNDIKESTPYKYDIYKSNISNRTLSLIHPKSQIDQSRFYGDNSQAILYLCSKSPASIRSPVKLSTTYYGKEKDSSDKYKSFDIKVVEDELSTKYISNFFSYRGYSKLYKFFNSYDYVELEKKYHHMFSADIANFFPSIYTHSITWAVKSKEYAKKNVSYENQISAQFDRIMQRSNNNETNGITIGSEVSRVFSEILLQKVDLAIIGELKEFDLHYDHDYVFYRYVDDYFIFSQAKSTCSKVLEVIADNLKDFNLHLSDKKVKQYERPFSTKKSALINLINTEIDVLKDLLLEIKIIDGYKKQYIKSIYRSENLLISFVNKVKTQCTVTGSSYEDVSNYIVSALVNLIIKIQSRYFIPKDEEKHKVDLRYRATINLLFDIAFFFYSIMRTVPPSYKMAKAIIICDSFFNNHISEHIDYYRSNIYKHVNSLKFDSQNNSSRTNFASIEVLNIALATSKFGDDYKLPSSFFTPLLTDKCSYFEVISILFYIKDDSQYLILKKQIEKTILAIIELHERPIASSEAIHLILDTLSCPYVSNSTKRKILETLRKELSIPNGFDRNEAIANFEETYWFVNWKKFNLLKLIKKKSLIGTY